MFLIKLQSKEKFSFLQLAHYIARIDSNYGKKEEEIILEYCSEMGIENLEIDETNFNLENILKDFKSKESKKIVLLEIMTLIHIDRNFHKKEKELVEKIISFFKMDQNDMEDYSLWGKSVANLYEQGKNYIKK